MGWQAEARWIRPTPFWEELSCPRELPWNMPNEIGEKEKPRQPRPGSSFARNLITYVKASTAPARLSKPLPSACPKLAVRESGCRLQKRGRFRSEREKAPPGLCARVRDGADASHLPRHYEQSAGL